MDSTPPRPAAVERFSRRFNSGLFYWIEILLGKEVKWRGENKVMFMDNLSATMSFRPSPQGIS